MCLTRYRIALNGNNNKEAILERGGGAAPYANYVRTGHGKKKPPPNGRGFSLACLTRFERAAFRVGADQTGYSKMQINKGIRRFLGFFPSIVFVTYIPKPSSIVHSSHRCVVEMW